MPSRLRLLGPLIILALYGICFVFGGVLVPHNPLAIHGNAIFQGSSWQHPMGTDQFGRDLLSRVIVATRLTLVVSLASTVLAAGAGTLLGMMAAYRGGVADALIMRGVDVLVSVPPIILAIFVVTFWGRGLVDLVITLGLLGIPAFIRLAHVETQHVRAQDYVAAAIATGCPQARIMRVHVLRNIVQPVAVQAALWAGQVVIIASALGFLGLGPPAPTITWGSMIADSFNNMARHPAAVLWPAAALSLFVVATNWLVDEINGSRGFLGGIEH